MYGEAGIDVDVGQGEEIFGLCHLHAGFFSYFAGNAFLTGLGHVDEASGEVQRPFGRLFGAAAHQQLVVLVQYQGDGGGRGVEVVDETAVGALLRLLVMNFEMG